MNETVHNWQRETDEHGMCWLTLNVPGGANVLSHAVLEELDGILDDLHQNPPHGLVFASGKNGAFIAGADVGEFSQIIDEQQAQEMIRRGQAIMDRIAALPFPTLALINGYCLGGGLELSLACDYRIAQEGARTRIGLPEVKLGIHPGFGGSVRSIQRIGPLAAMNLMLSGRTVDPRAARRMGLVDEAVPERQLRAAAVYYLMNRPPVQAPDWKGRLANLQPVRPLLARIMRRQVAARAPRAHYPAPYALLDLWVEHGSDERAMLEAEAESVARLIVGQTARNLVRVFELQNRLKSLGREGAEDIHHVHVIGGGVMGGDIAAWCALQGFRVTVQDQDTNALGRAVHRAQRIFKRRFKRDRLAIQAAMDRFIPDNRGVGLRHADVVI
ncbi:MAG: enoyl-CoA hydratase-related protein, partial [Gammaproteobacteria bacterium]